MIDAVQHHGSNPSRAPTEGASIRTMPHRTHDPQARSTASQRRARSRRSGAARLLPATLRVLLGGALAVLAAMVCTLLTGPDHGLAALRVVEAQQWATMPAPSGDSNRCALECEVVDVDDDDDDNDESRFPGDDAAADTLATFAPGTVRGPRQRRARSVALDADKSQFATDSHLARGPPGAREAALL